MCKRRFPGASQSSGSYVQFVIQCQRLRSRLLLPRCLAVEAGRWTTEMPSWPVFLPTCSASSVGDERGSTAHLRPASLRPHLRRTHQPPLAPGPGESGVQDGRAHVQGHSWNCAVIPESTGSCRRSAWSTFAPLCSDQSSDGAVRETVYRRRPGLPSRPTHHPEQSAGQRDISPVSSLDDRA